MIVITMRKMSGKWFSLNIEAQGKGSADFDGECVSYLGCVITFLGVRGRIAALGVKKKGSQE